MAADRLASVRVKVARAKRHMDELAGELKAFHDSNPYAVESKPGEGADKTVYVVTKVSEAPASISAVTGEVLHNLRSALNTSRQMRK